MTPPAPVALIDLRGVGCPLNYVKTRVAIDRVAPGECIEVWVYHGDAEENVPRSCDEDGFAVLLQEATAGDPGGRDGYVRLVVQRPH